MAANEGPKDFSLEGRAALVIGAERVIGTAAATVLAEAGADVLLASQDVGAEKALNDAAKAVAAAGRKAVVQSQRAAIRADVSATCDLAVKQLGGLHIIVNAMDAPLFAPAEATDDSMFDRVIENNVKTVWMACQEGARVMSGLGGGAIVNITSIFAERGVPNAGIYCAAKAAVLNLTRALALEWARKNVRINALEAGWVEEEGSPALDDDEFSKSLIKYLPENRLVKPEELGGALLYLVSPAAGFVTGESIAVDGGLRCRI
jgi:NAD(P)-dependent dehydrogenase (short-subunit alcohol dehydrogenase family)